MERPDCTSMQHRNGRHEEAMKQGQVRIPCLSSVPSQSHSAHPAPCSSGAHHPSHLPHDIELHELIDLHRPCRR